MPALPAQDLRSNLGTYAVSNGQLPAVAQQMVAYAAPETFDPSFLGQELKTTYLDTRGFDLRKARRKKDHYLTIRVRCYRAMGQVEGYALSAKTEDQKWRAAISPGTADLLLTYGMTTPPQDLPADLQARWFELARDQPLIPVVCVRCRRYAVENAVDRLTLDCDIRTDTGKCFPCNVLEHKSTQNDVSMPLAVLLRPIKLSKFLWATH